jgi:folate-binding protein YgfZ
MGTEDMKASLLPDRNIVRFAGDNARAFLNSLFTANIETLTADESCYAALLTAQGKIIVDVFVTEAPAERGEGFYLDAPKSQFQIFLAKMNGYNLRKKYAVEDLSGRLAIMAAWDGTATMTKYPCHTDPRLAALGQRIMLPPDQAAAVAAEIGAELVLPEQFEAHRIALGVPRGDLDFAYGDAFPHEADMDQLHGIDFKKGCFVGQEVVQRMERRSTARTRVVPVMFDGAAPSVGAAVMAAERSVGRIGSTMDGRGLALLRLDRAEDALAAGHPLKAGDVTLRLVKPDWIRFPFPGESKRKGGEPE